jgi:copper resistance protein C
MVRSLVLMAALLVGAASAHAYLSAAAPAPGSTLEGAPEEVVLTFTEPIEVRFSTLKVYRLEVADEAMPEDPANPTERELQRLNALAAQLASEVLEEDDAEEPARADTGLLTEARTAAEVTLGLREDLEPGVYVVMWDVLSIDTHWTREHFVFLVAPSS